MVVPRPQTIASPSPAELWLEVWATQSRSCITLDALVVFAKQQGLKQATSLVDVLLVDQMQRWAKEPGPRVEEYLALFPPVGVQHDAFGDLIYGELRERKRLGLPIVLTDFVTRFPTIAGELRKQIELADWVAAESVLAEQPTDDTPAAESTSATATSSDLAGSPRCVGNYELINEIARGGAGVVYKARHRQLHRIVALKMLRPERVASREQFLRFQNEVKVNGLLDHPNILPVYDVGSDETQPFFTTRLIDTGSLTDNIDRFEGDQESAAKLVMAIALAVHHAHQRGVLHRDIKPSNVLIDKNDNPLLADFGLARLTNQPSDLTHSGEILGTPVWMAPEQAIPKPLPATIACDIYGLGSVLYYLLTGQPPFGGDTIFNTLMQIRDGDVKPPSELVARIHRDLEMICLKAIEKSPGDRYATAEDLAVDLQRYLLGQPITIRPQPHAERIHRWIRKHPATSAIAMVVMLSAILFSVLAIHYTINEAKLNQRLASIVRESERSKQQTVSLERKTNVANERAVSLRRETKLIRDRAITIGNDYRNLLYAAHIRSADEALRKDDVRQVDDLLRREIPKNDELEDLRGFEWHWLRQQSQIAPVTNIIPMHNPRCLCYSPDGQYLVVGDSSGLAWLLDAETKQVIRSWPTQHQMIESVSFSPSSTRIATAGSDGWVRVCDRETGKLAGNFPVLGDSSVHAVFLDENRLLVSRTTGRALIFDCRTPAVPIEFDHASVEVMAIAASPPRGLFALLGSDGIEVFDSESLASYCVIPHLNPPWRVRGLAFSSSGRLLAAETGLHQVYVYDMTDPGTPAAEFAGEIMDEIRSVCFSSDESFLTVASSTGGVHLLSLTSNIVGHKNSVQQWQAHENRINAIAFSARDRTIVTAGRDNKLLFWKPTVYQPYHVLSNTHFVDAHRAEFAYSPDGKWIYSIEHRSIGRIDPHGGQPKMSINRDAPPLRHLAVSNDGKLLVATGSGDDPVAEMYHTDKLNSLSTPAWRIEGEASGEVALSPTGTLVAIADWKRDRLCIFDAGNGKSIKVIPASQCWSVAFTPQGDRLAVATMDDIEVYDTRSWQRVHRLKGHLSTTTKVVCSPDGQYWASGSHDRSIRLWKVQSGKSHALLLGHRQEILDIAFSPDSRSLATVSRFGNSKIWHVSSGEQLCEFYQSTINRPYRLKFSPSGKEFTMRLEHGELIQFSLSTKTIK